MDPEQNANLERRVYLLERRLCLLESPGGRNSKLWNRIGKIEQEIREHRMALWDLGKISKLCQQRITDTFATVFDMARQFAEGKIDGPT